MTKGTSNEVGNGAWILAMAPMVLRCLSTTYYALMSGNTLTCSKSSLETDRSIVIEVIYMYRNFFSLHG